MPLHQGSGQSNLSLSIPSFVFRIFHHNPLPAHCTSKQWQCTGMLSCAVLGTVFCFLAPTGSGRGHTGIARTISATSTHTSCDISAEVCAPEVAAAAAVVLLLTLHILPCHTTLPKHALKIPRPVQRQLRLRLPFCLPSMHLHAPAGVWIQITAPTVGIVTALSCHKHPLPVCFISCLLTRVHAPLLTCRRP